MSDPVSWLLIEPGWRVVGPDGEEIGRVEEVIGDSTHDIWDGLAIATGMLASPRYVPSEQVAEITEERGPARARRRPSSSASTSGGSRRRRRRSSRGGQPSPSAPRACSRRASATVAERIPLLRRILLWFGIKRD